MLCPSVMEGLAMEGLRVLHSKELEGLVQFRALESRLGERVQTCPEGEDWPSWLHKCSAPVVLLGIAEDIGVRANEGRGGTGAAWEAFLGAFMNMQHNAFLEGSQIAVLGFIEAEAAADMSVEALREETLRVDARVRSCLAALSALKKFPVVIGGGHNNAYPLLAGVASGQGLKGGLSVLNLDAHADWRKMEGRHSGNGFRYARAEGFLDKYGIWGIHESYIPSYVSEAIEQDSRIRICSYEALYVRKELSSAQAFEDMLSWLEGSACGLEVDMDVVAGMPSSAMSPCGLSLRALRHKVWIALERLRPLYVHVCEAIPQGAEGRRMVGKALAYLVHDIVRAFLRA